MCIRRINNLIATFLFQKEIARNMQKALNASRTVSCFQYFVNSIERYVLSKDNVNKPRVNELLRKMNPTYLNKALFKMNVLFTKTLFEVSLNYIIQIRLSTSNVNTN